MNTLTLAGDYASSFTFVQNNFIDHHMKDINESQIKIYLYLLRSIGGNNQVSVSSIADFFNDSERDVIRALKYLDKQKLIMLEYDKDKQPAGIRLLQTGESRTRSQVSEGSCTEPEKTVFSESAPGTLPEKKTARNSFGMQELSGFTERSDIKELIYVAETYLKRTLSQKDLCALLFFNKELGFSADLIEYLIEFCVSNKKKSLSFMEKTAKEWAKKGISSVEEAKAFTGSAVPPKVYEVFNAFGIRNRAPVSAEIEYVKKWTQDYDLPMDVIAEACSRTVIKIQKPSFEYADRILEGWHRQNVHHISDIKALDESRSLRAAAEKPAKTVRKRKTAVQKTSGTDYDALVKELMEN